MYKRIICLTTETVEVLYLLGVQDNIVGISGYTTRPEIARKEKPKVSAFTSAKIDKILALQPDLVLTCTDLQADIAATLIKAGVEVHAFNQRSIAEILRMITTLGLLVNRQEKAKELVNDLENKIAVAKDAAKKFSVKPRIYFEEWDEPTITGIRWVSELIEIAGGVDCFAELSIYNTAAERIITHPLVLARLPDIIIGSWCGKKFKPCQVIARDGWGIMPAVKNGFIVEIKSADILQAGPSVITEGLPQLQQIIQRWQNKQQT
jgi:iron complex transport system substrate-binding protein